MTAPEQEDPHPARGARGATATAAAAVLLLGGLLLLGLYRVVGGTEHHAYAPGASPPRSVELTTGHVYHLSVPGGVKALHEHGLAQGTLRCTLTAGDATPLPLALNAEPDGSRATNVIASFTAPFTAPARVDCAGWGSVFVDDAEDSAADIAGWFLLAAIVALTLGSGVGLSAVRARFAADFGTRQRHPVPHAPQLGVSADDQGR